LLFTSYENANGVNVYITSDEEIKEGDYVVQTNFEKTNTQVIKCETEFQTKIANSKDGSFSKNKIILTTDQDLITDGVQSIHDTFIRWLLRHPKCDVVEVKKQYITPCGDVVDFCLDNERLYYKIITPQEEPEKEYWKPKVGEKVRIKVFSNWSMGRYIGYDYDREVHLVREPEEGGGHLLSSKHILPYSDTSNESKQKTLEEAAENYGWRVKTNTFSDPVKANDLANSAKEDFIEGAKWQAEQIPYIIEQYLETAFISKEQGYMNPEKWFEQFKKK
jgi:hypothetical protein